MKSSAKKAELVSVDDLFSTEESRADAQREKVLEIPLSELHPFKNHPFKVKDDEAMMETADSVRQYDNISQHKENAWTRVRSGDEEFYMSWSSGGSMWVRTVSNAPLQNGTSYVAKVQVGTYSASGGVLGIQNYEFTTPYMIGSIVISFILAWYCENVTFENCTIIGTQPLCYCQGLKLINCKMVDCDLAFERSHVQASLTAPILSIKNPLTGSRITVPQVGEIIRDIPGADGEVLVENP